MAGGDRPVTKPSEVDPSLQKNYRQIADHYQAVSEKAEARLEQRRTDLSAASADLKQQNKWAVEQQKALDSTNQDVDNFTQRIQVLEARQAAGTASADDLKELDRTRESLADTQKWAEAQQGDYENRLRAVVAAQQKVDDLKIEVTQLDKSNENFKAASSFADQADRAQSVANIAQTGDVEATRAAVYAEAEKHNDTFRQYASDQAETFEKLQRTQADIKSYQGELDRSLKDQATLEARVKQLELEGPPDKLSGAMRDLEFRKERTQGLQDSLASAKEALPQLQEQNTRLDALAKLEREETDTMRKLAESNDPGAVEAQMRDRAETAGMVTDLGSVTNDDRQIEQSLETDGPITSPSQVPDGTIPNPVPQGVSASNDGAATDDTQVAADANVDDLDGLTPTTPAPADAQASNDNGNGSADAPKVDDLDGLSPTAAPTIVDDDMLATTPDASADATPDTQVADTTAAAVTEDAPDTTPTIDLTAPPDEVQVDAPDTSFADTSSDAGFTSDDADTGATADLDADTESV